MILAYSVAAVHAAAVVLLLTGAFFALRWRRVVPVHLAVTAVIGAVHLVGADCPLTTWERALRERAGAGYDGGFLDQYLLRPLSLDGDPAVQLGMYAVVLVPNLVGYGLLLARRHQARRAAAGAKPDAALAQR